MKYLIGEEVYGSVEWNTGRLFPFNHKEADTRMVLHVVDAILEGYKKSSTDREHCIVVLDVVAVTKLSTISDQKAGPDNMGCFWNNTLAVGSFRNNTLGTSRVVESESGVGVGGVVCFQLESGVGVGFQKLLESESGVGVGFLKLLESESGVGVGFSKLLESESGVGVGTFVAITDSNVY